MIGILAVIGGILMIIGIFLAWYEVKGLGSSSGWDFLTNDMGPEGIKETMCVYAAIPLLIAGILTLLLFITNFIDALKLPKFVPLISLIMTIVALVFCIAAVLTIGDQISEYGIGSYGIGVILCILGTILAIIGPILALIKRENPVAAYESSFDNAASVVSSDDKE